MSDAWRTFTESLSSSFQNFGAFFKIIFPSLLVSTLIFTGMSFLLFGADFFNPASSAFDTPSAVSSSSALYLLYLIVNLVINLIVYSGISVNAYRYLLADFKPSWVPFQFKWNTSFAFFGWTLLIVLIFYGLLILISIPFGLLIGLSYLTESSAFIGLIAILGGLALLIILMWFLFRFGNKLVARALDIDLSLGNAWSATAGKFGYFFGITLFCVLSLILFFVLLVAALAIFGTVGPASSALTISPIWSVLISIGSLILNVLMYGFAYELTARIYRKFFGAASVEADVFA